MKTVLITGANKGIGFETAKQLAQMDYFVYLGSRDKVKGTAAVNRLKDSGISNVDSIEIDVTDIQSLKQAKQALENKIPALDVLINNAAIAGKQGEDVSVTDIENLRNLFETNFFGAVQTIRQFIDLLRKANDPIIINVSSELGSLTMHSSPERNPNWKKFHAYASSKTALNALTVLLANEFKGTHLKINSVSPGYTATDLNQQKGTQTPEQGAKIIVNGVILAHHGTTGTFFKEQEIPW